MKTIIILVYFALLFGNGARVAYGLSVDEFEGLQSVEARPAQGVAFSTNSSFSSIGGTRGIVAEVTAGSNPFNRLAVSVFSGTIGHSQDAPDIAGYSRISWDGDQQANVLTTNGLGSIDLLQDFGTAMQLEVFSYDRPGGLSIDLKVTIHDAVDPNLRSIGVLTISEPISQSSNPLTLSIPFETFFPDPSALGPANFRTVGALTLDIDGRFTPTADVSIGWIGTNGICRLVPNSVGRVIDECGVCAGDNSSCADCLGVPNGRAVLDRCGVCNGDGMSCIACTSQEISPLLAAMDGGAKFQEAQAKYLAKLLLKYKNTKSNKVFLAKILPKIHELQIRNWTISWWIPSTIKTCTSSVFCTTASNLSILEEYRAHNNELRDLTVSIADRLQRSSKAGAKVVKTYKSKILKQHSLNVSYSNRVPDKTYSCSTP